MKEKRYDKLLKSAGGISGRAEMENYGCYAGIKKYFF